MKTKPVKRKKVSTPELRKRADELGQKERELKEQSEEANAALTRKREEIKSFAANEGIKLGKEMMVLGDLYDVGYCEVEGRWMFNRERAKQALPKELYAQCLSLQLDENKIKKLVAQKKISREKFLLMFDKTANSRRIVVREHGKKELNPDEIQ